VDTLSSDELWNALAPLLPAHPPSAKGGRPRADDRACLRGILYVLREGCRWQSLPRQDLDCPSGSTCWRRFQEWTGAGVWQQAHCHLVAALGQRDLLRLGSAVVDSASVRALHGGEHTGANPTDRAKRGVKRHLITDGLGVPLVVQIGPANRRDEQWLPSLLWWLWVVVCHLGWRLPREFFADRGYGFAWSIALVLAWGLRARVAARGSPHGSGLGRRRYVVERAHSWFMRFRRLIVCHERTGGHYQGLYQLAACVICARRLRDGQSTDARWQPFEGMAA
jgi:transposase